MILKLLINAYQSFHTHTHTWRVCSRKFTLSSACEIRALLKPRVAFCLCLRSVGNIPLYWEKINDPQWSLRRWKRFKLEKSFDRFSFHSFSFIRRGAKVFTKTFSFLFAIMGFYMIAYEKILGIVRSSRLAQEKLCRK